MTTQVTPSFRHHLPRTLSGSNSPSPDCAPASSELLVDDVDASVEADPFDAESSEEAPPFVSPSPNDSSPLRTSHMTTLSKPLPHRISISITVCQGNDSNCLGFVTRFPTEAPISARQSDNSLAPVSCSPIDSSMHPNVAESSPSVRGATVAYCAPSPVLIVCRSPHCLSSPSAYESVLSMTGCPTVPAVAVQQPAAGDASPRHPHPARPQPHRPPR